MTLTRSALLLGLCSSFVSPSQCAKQYLSVVPGKFLLFDNMKDAERSTYTFIAEMEEGGSVNTQDLVKKNAGGASLHPGSGAAKAEEAGPEDGIKVLSISGSSPSPMPAKKVVAPGVTFVVGEKVSALWTDGKWYDAVIKKVIPDTTKYQLTYTAYGNTVNIEGKSIKKLAAPAAAAAKPAGKK
jgi:hypothetical protein